MSTKFAVSKAWNRDRINFVGECIGVIAWCAMGLGVLAWLVMRFG